MGTCPDTGVRRSVDRWDIGLVDITGAGGLLVQVNGRAAQPMIDWLAPFAYLACQCSAVCDTSFSSVQGFLPWHHVTQPKFALTLREARPGRPTMMCIARAEGSRALIPLSMSTRRGEAQLLLR